MFYLLIIGFSFILISIYISGAIEKLICEGKRKKTSGIVLILLWMAFLFGLFFRNNIIDKF
jgi:hypothetical protein